jgi:hypothetical protein
MSRPAESYIGISNLPYSTSRGISDSAVAIGAITHKIRQDQQNTAESSIALHNTLMQIDELERDCGLPNWGGENENAISRVTASEAKAFLAELPTSYQSPEVLPEPSGALAFEWRTGAFRSVIVSFVGNHRVEYSALSGRSNASFGYCAFHGIIPLEIVRLIREVTQQNAVS